MWFERVSSPKTSRYFSFRPPAVIRRKLSISSRVRGGLMAASCLGWVDHAPLLTNGTQSGQRR